ncbi:phage/plasmid primase, P4 family [Methanocella sp. MCL-LM]|uniref:phage/plasmid primase, P4 family n=1 Tax=Methanocella sp. MCL-LM TaxID=3412035 RepID=UPI003C732719
MAKVRLSGLRRAATVFPVSSNKIPLVKWRAESTTDENKIREWWTMWPNAFIGIDMEKSGLTAFDFDKKNGGLEAYEEICCVHPEMRNTYTESTHSGGIHVLFTSNELHVRTGTNVFMKKVNTNDWVNRLPDRCWSGVDTRGDGGLCIVAPSKDAAGEYKVTNDLPIQPISEGLIELLRKVGKVLDADSFEKDESDPAYNTVDAAHIPIRFYREQHNPPCIRGILTNLRAGKACNDENFALLCYYLGLNIAKDDIIAIFSQSPRFKCDITEYQVKVASQKGYKCLRCATMQDNGLCPGGEDCNCEKSPAWNYRNNFYNKNWTYNTAKEDVGIAEMLVDIYHDDIRYVVCSDQWHVWNSGYWPVAVRERPLWQLINSMAGLVKDRVLFLSGNIKNISDEDSRNAFVKFVDNQYRQYRYMRTGKGIKSIIDAAAHINDRIAINSLDELDSDKHLINLLNGVYDLNAGKFISHGEATRAFLMTRQSAVAYNKAANCPKFLQFIEEITCGDDDLARDIQKWLGYCLSGYTNEQEFRVLKGVGDNGKSLLMKVILHIMGSYADTANSTAYTYSPGGSNGRFDFGDKYGLRLLVCSETSTNERWNVQKVQSHTGDEQISGEQKYKDGVSYRPMFKLTFLFNHVPTVKKDVAMGKRLHIMPFDLKLEDGQKDIFLADKLMSEIEGILNWMIDGYKLWQAEGFKNKCQAMAEATSEYWQAVDYMSVFISEICDTGKDKNGDKYWCFPDELFKAYDSWQKNYPEAENLSQKVFASKINSLGYPLESRRSKDKLDENGKPVVYKARVGLRPKSPKLEDYNSFIAPMKKANVECF